MCPFLPPSFYEIPQDPDDRHGISKRSKLSYKNEYFRGLHLE